MPCADTVLPSSLPVHVLLPKLGILLCQCRYRGDYILRTEFAVDPEQLIEKHRMGFAFLVHCIQWYRRERREGLPPYACVESAKDLRKQLGNWGVKGRDRQRVLEGRPVK